MGGTEPSLLSLAAAAAYALVAAMCLAAAIAAVSTHQRTNHAIVWAVVAVFFAALVAVRVFDLEDGLRDLLRDAMRASDLYADRRAVQLPLTIAGLALGSLMILLWPVRQWLRAQGRRERAIALAQFGAAAMVLVMGLRVISYSPLDRLLYGPLKLNWVGDIGAAAVVLGAAGYYLHAVLRRGRTSRDAPPQ